MIMLSGSAGFPGHCSLRASPGCPIGIPWSSQRRSFSPLFVLGRKHSLTRLVTHGRSTLRWTAFIFYHAYSYICPCRTPRRIKNCNPTWFLSSVTGVSLSQDEETNRKSESNQKQYWQVSFVSSGKRAECWTKVMFPSSVQMSNLHVIHHMCTASMCIWTVQCDGRSLLFEIGNLWGWQYSHVFSPIS